MAELKTCPFCGSDAEPPEEYDTRSGLVRWMVACGSCNARTSGLTAESATEAWNRRPPTIPADVGRRAMEALKAGVGASDGYGNALMEAAITELQQALAAPSGGQRE